MNKTTKIIIISIICALVLTFIAGISVYMFTQKDSRFDISKSPATLTSTPDYGQNYINNIVFLGDSTMYGMLEDNLLTGGDKSSQVWSGRDGTFPLDHNTYKATVTLLDTNEEMLITQALSDRKPRYLVITVGRENGVPYCDKETFTGYYTKLIEAVKKASPDTEIMLQSIIPVTGKFQRKNPEFSCDSISKCNEWICEMAEKQNVKFLNTAEVLSDSSGRLLKEFANDSGETLSSDGFKKMFEYIRTHGYK